MNKKDIYEHLAKIYLDASSKKTKKRNLTAFFKKPVFVSALIIFVVGISALIYFARNYFAASGPGHLKPPKFEVALVLNPEIVKINFDFEPAKEEIYSITLNNLNMARFDTLGFSIRKADYENQVTVRLELANVFNERSEISFSDVPSYKWKDCRISLSDFKNITDWSEMSRISFIVERRNSDKKKGIVYIDNVRLLR